MIKRLRVFLLRLRSRRQFRQKDYLDAYRWQTDQRVSLNPHQAIGGLWDQVGQLQRDFLVAHGLQPQHRFLDLGCGTLRGGRCVIPFLGVGCYTGIDLSPACIDAARALVLDEGLEDKKPRLLVSGGDLTFREFEGEAFDVILAQSVFTHLLPEHISECFAHVGNVMQKDSVFYFTYRPSGGDPFVRRTLKDFEQSIAFLRELAGDRYSLEEFTTEQYPHPRGQKMVAARLR